MLYCYPATNHRSYVVRPLHQLRKRLILITHHSFEREFLGAAGVGSSGNGCSGVICLTSSLQAPDLCPPSSVGQSAGQHTGIQASVLAAEQAIFW